MVRHYLFIKFVSKLYGTASTCKTKVWSSSLTVPRRIWPGQVREVRGKISLRNPINSNIMTPIRLTFILSTLFLITSCGFDRFNKDLEIAEEICSEVRASKCILYYTEDKLASDDNKKYFVELDVIGSKLLNPPNAEEKVLASYCATQLYKRLDPKTIRMNYGYNIIFDSKEDPLDNKKNFFEVAELKNALKAFENIDNYINAILTNK